MRVLLDTHTVVWYVFSDPKLTTVARTAILDVTNEAFVSPASYWEMAIKVHTGKWILTQQYPAVLDLALNVYGFRILPILPQHTAGLIGLPDHHKDPFDRLLVAQALIEGISLVSADAIFDQYGIPRLWN